MLITADQIVKSNALPTKQGLARFEIDTDVIGSEFGHQIWYQAHSALFEINAETDAFRKQFYTKVAMYNAGPMLIGVGESMPQRYHRTAAKISSDGIDHYFLLGCRQGQFFGTCDDKPVLIEEGDVCLFNLLSPADVTSVGNDALVVVLPRAMLAPLLSDPDVRGGVVLKRDSAMGRIIMGSLLSIFDNCHLIDSDDAAQLSRMAANLVASCYGPIISKSETSQNRLRGASLLAIKRYIDDNLGARALDVENLTKIFGLSRATIYRTFKDLGGIADFIKQRRMRRALIDLSAPDRRHLHISEIAFSLGFANRATFTRVFTSHYGMSPSQVRAEPDAALERFGNQTRSDESLFGEWLQTLI